MVRVIPSMERLRVMVRYHLIEFFNKHKLIQKVMFTLLFFLFIIYTMFLFVDLYNVVSTSILNYEIVKTDDSLIELESYELDGYTLKVDDKKYKDVSVVFYGIETDDDKVYFSKDSNTLIQSLPKNFGFTFLLSSNAFIVLVSLGVLAVALFIMHKNDTPLTVIKESKIHIFFIVLFVLLSLIMISSLMLLY